MWISMRQACWIQPGRPSGAVSARASSPDGSDSRKTCVAAAGSSSNSTGWRSVANCGWWNLKRQANALSRELGREEPYQISGLAEMPEAELGGMKWHTTNHVPSRHRRPASPAGGDGATKTTRPIPRMAPSG